jgi:hypothetical protein
MSSVLRILSQCWVRYRSSPLSVEHDGTSVRLRAGDQLRDAEVVCDGRATRLHELTARPGVHLLLSRDASSDQRGASELVSCHRISSWPGTGAVAVRPDGHVGFTSGDGEGLADWLTLVGAMPAHHDGRVCR